MRIVLGGFVAAVVACGPRARTAVEPQPPKRTEPSSPTPTVSTEHLCGHYRGLLTDQRTLDPAEASRYVEGCLAVFEWHRQVLSPRGFADVCTCADAAATVEAFARCVAHDGLLAIAMPSTPLTPAEERSKELYLRAEALVRQERWAEAVPVYEEAYYLAPDKHGLAYKIGIAAWNARDCDTTKEYLEHFLRYADRERFPARLANAESVLLEIEVSGCATR